MAVAILSTNNLNFTSNGTTPVATITATSAGIVTFSESANAVELRGVAAPTTATSAANKAYVDAISSGIKWKAPVVAVSDVNGPLATAYVNNSTVDGIIVTTGQRILLSNQTPASDNGVYIVQATGAPVRSSDVSTGYAAAGVAVFVEKGTVYADTAWVCTADTGTDIVGTNLLPFVQFTGLGQIVAGSGITKTGNVISVDSTVLRTTGAQTVSGVKTFSATPITSANFQLTGTAADSGYIDFASTTAPTVTTNKLYVISGVLTYNGAPIGSISAGTIGRLSYYSGASVLGSSGISVVNGAGTNDALSLNKVTTNGGYANTGGEMLLSGGNLRLNDTIQLNLGTTTKFSLYYATGFSELRNSTGAGTIRIQNDDVTGFIVNKIGTATNATKHRWTNSADAVLLDLNGDLSADMRTNMVWSNGSLRLNDTIPLNFSTSGATTMTHSGTNFNITNTTGNTVLYNNTITASTIDFRLSTATSATRVLSSANAPLFTVDGAGVTSVLSTAASTSTTTGALIVSGGVGIAGDTRCGGISYAVSHNATSDRRLKRDISDINTDDIAKLGKLESKVFFWKEGSKSKQYGIIAQQVEEHLPELIETDDDSFKSVNIMSLVGLLLAKVNDLQRQVDTLKKA